MKGASISGCHQSEMIKKYFLVRLMKQLRWLLIGVGMLLTDFASIDRDHSVLQERDGRRTVGVGDKVRPVSVTRLDGTSVRIGGKMETGAALVAVFLSTECPVAKRYGGRLNRLYQDFQKRGLSFVGIYPNENDSEEAIGAFLKAADLRFPIVRDAHGTLTRAFGATMTPQAFLLNNQGFLIYRGAIDDNRYENRVKSDYLRDAVESHLAGKDLTPAETKALGCMIHLSEAAALSSVNYSKHIAPIVRDNCQGCHRPGQVAPFSLMSYQQAKRWGHEMKEYVEARLMPPWRAKPGYGQFRGDRSLSQTQIDLIKRWVDEGMIEGDKADLPEPRVFSSNWSLDREPDLIVEMPEEYVLGAEGDDDYRHFVIPNALIGDRYVEAVDVRPGNYTVVHHVILYTDRSGRARELDAADPGPGYSHFGGTGFQVSGWLGGWAPGTFPVLAPEKTGAKLHEGADIVMQVHYYRSGIEERDRTKVGLYFCKDETPTELELGLAINDRFRIPAGEKRHRLVAKRRVDRDIYAVDVYPHMHLLGKEMRVWAELPDGELLPMIHIENWDFNWQESYVFDELLFLPKGSEIKLEAFYDNSAQNPHNPSSPPRAVGWGEETTDEMCIAFFNYLDAKRYRPQLGSR